MIQLDWVLGNPASGTEKDRGELGLSSYPVGQQLNYQKVDGW
jgi:hypothetical protein